MNEGLPRMTATWVSTRERYPDGEPVVLCARRDGSIELLRLFRGLPPATARRCADVQARQARGEDAQGLLSKRDRAILGDPSRHTPHHWDAAATRREDMISPPRVALSDVAWWLDIPPVPGRAP